MSATFDWTRIERLLVVRMDNIGDVVMLSPALSSIRAAAPRIHITLLASRAGARAAVLLPQIDEVIPHRASWQELSSPAPPAATELALITRLSEERLDAAVIFTSFSQDAGPPAMACYLAGIPRRAGWAPTFSGAVLSHPVKPPASSVHQAERNVQLVRALGAPARSTAIELEVPPDANQEAALRLRDVGLEPGGYIALFPGASAPARRYRPERFAHAARRLWEVAGLPSLVLGSERDRSLAEAITREAGAATRSVVGDTDLPTAAALVTGAALVIGNNSLALHLADAFTVPVVAAYAGTDLESQWGPRFTATRLLREPTVCAPCYEIECPVGHECLDIPGHRLASAGLELLGRGGSRGTTGREPTVRRPAPAGRTVVA